ncbi:MAG: RDD family protein [Akkermansiaceae bacterium]
MPSASRKQQRLDTLQRIELAEGVEVHLRIAGPYVRSLAYLLDLAIRVVASVVAYLLLLLIGAVIGLGVSSGLGMLVTFFIMFFYTIVFEAGKRGATPGKRVMGLRVVDASGAPVTWGQSFIRNMLRIADGMPVWGYAIGLSSTLMTRKFQRLGDLLANTVVVYEKMPQIHVAAMPPVLASVAPSAPLTREEQVAVMAFRERGGMWSEARRVELADHAKELTGASGATGMSKLLGVAHWLEEEKKGV